MRFVQVDIGAGGQLLPNGSRFFPLPAAQDSRVTSAGAARARSRSAGSGQALGSFRMTSGQETKLLPYGLAALGRRTSPLL